MPLTERQEQILKAVVDAYIATAHPVGSAAVVARARLPVSSATVRNELALLEESGYLHQLHTSGGRVPTNLGYRYYVERLMEADDLTNSEVRTIRRQFRSAHSELQEWLKLAASVMAVRMHNVGLITAPRPLEVRLRHLEVVSIQHAVALLIVVLQDGTVLQEMMTLSEAQSQDDLSALAALLNQRLHGLTASGIEGQSASLPALQALMGQMTAHLLRRAEEAHAEVYHAGLADMIRQPEFVTPRPGEPAQLSNERLRQMVDFLYQEVALQRFLSRLPVVSEVQVVIGSGQVGGLEDYSFVLGRYGPTGDSSGYLGVVGPTRLQYPRAVALVRYMTDLMTDLLQAF